MLALSHASSGLRGGIYKSLLDDLTILLAPDAEPFNIAPERIIPVMKVPNGQ